METMAGSSSSDDEFFTNYKSIGNWADYQEMVDKEEEQTRLRNALNVRAVLDRIPVAHNQIASAGGLALHLTAPKKKKHENPWKKNPGALAEMIGGTRVPLGHTIHIHFDEEDPTPEEQEQQQQQIEKEKQEERKTPDTQYKKEKEDLFAPPRKVPEWKKQEDEEKQKKRVTRRGRGKRESFDEKPTKRIRVRKESLVEYLTEPAVPHDPTPTPPPTPAPPFTTENQYQALQAQNEAIHQESNIDETNTDSISEEEKEEEEEKKSMVLSRRQRKRQQQEQRKEALQKRARLENGLTLFAIFLFGLLLGLFRSSST